MKKYSKEFFEQILKKLTNFDDEYFNNPFFFKYDEWISFYIKKDGFKYCVDSPLDCNGGKSDIFDVYITKTNTNFPPDEYHVQYILKGHKLLTLQQLNLTKEFRDNNYDRIEGKFKSPLAEKADIDFEDTKKSSKKNLNLYVWWDLGDGEGDGYDEAVEIDDEVYAVLAEIDADGMELSEIEDKRIGNKLKKIEKRLLKDLEENSGDEWSDEIRCGCRINHDFSEN